MRKEKEREIRISNLKGNLKASKQAQERQRDIGEKIALGLLTGDGLGGSSSTMGRKGEELFDARLFNQSSGLSSGFGSDDSYSLYSQPLLQGGNRSNTIYRAQRGDGNDMTGGLSAEEQLAKLQDTSRFKPSKGFAGTDTGSDQHTGGRTQPVQFEKAKK